MTTPNTRDQERVAGARGDHADLTDIEPRLIFGRDRQLPIILQTEAAECGLACLAMIAGYHGHHASLSALRHRFSLSLKGLTAAQLIDMANVLGLQCRPLRLDMNELQRLQIPCILHWDLDHFVVLREVGKRTIHIHDPAAGERRLAHSEAGRHFTGVALELTKGPDFRRQRPQPAIALRKLAGSIQGIGRALAQIFGLALALELFALLAPCSCRS